jgi:hypothetical protein
MLARYLRNLRVPDPLRVVCGKDDAETTPSHQPPNPSTPLNAQQHHRLWVPHPSRVFVFAARVGCDKAGIGANAKTL